ncbi:MAG: hypothetical protein ACD_30C00038G0004, partial [uncultured bacterium]
APKTTRSDEVRSEDIFGAASRQDPEKPTTSTFESDERFSDLCASIEQAILEPLVVKTLKAAKKYDVKCIILGGGVAANQKLTENLKLEMNKFFSPKNRNLKLGIELFIPPPILCTDNAAMIASAAFFIAERENSGLIEERVSPTELQTNPNLSLSI